MSESKSDLIIRERGIGETTPESPRHYRLVCHLVTGHNLHACSDALVHVVAAAVRLLTTSFPT